MAEKQGIKLITCVVCGCDDLHACEGGCYWVYVDNYNRVGLCSRCAEKIISDYLKSKAKK